MPFPKGTRVQSRDRRLTGRSTGATHRCTLDGCPGLRVAVRWADGRTTFPCSKGLVTTTTGFKLG